VYICIRRFGSLFHCRNQVFVVFFTLRLVAMFGIESEVCQLNSIISVVKQSYSMVNNKLPPLLTFQFHFIC
jgi:hypothetical protein